MGKEQNEKKSGFHWKKILNYQSIVRQIPFFLFMALLAVAYIYNGHLADKLVKDINKTSIALKELQYEYKYVRGNVLSRSRQSEMIQAVQPLGLKEMTLSPVVLIDSGYHK